MSGGGLSKEPPGPNGETGTHQSKQISMVQVASGDGPVYVCRCDGREENARGHQIGFHQRTAVWGLSRCLRRMRTAAAKKPAAAVTIG